MSLVYQTHVSDIFDLEEDYEECKRLCRWFEDKGVTIVELSTLHYALEPDRAWFVSRYLKESSQRTGVWSRPVMGSSPKKSLRKLRNKFRKNEV